MTTTSDTTLGVGKYYTICHFLFIHISIFCTSRFSNGSEWINSNAKPLLVFSFFSFLSDVKMNQKYCEELTLEQNIKSRVQMYINKQNWFLKRPLSYQRILLAKLLSKNKMFFVCSPVLCEWDVKCQVFRVNRYSKWSGR